MKDPLVPVKFRFFEEMVIKPNNFRVTFQTVSPVVLFIGHYLENLVRSYVERFILTNVLKKGYTTHKLSQVHMTDPNIQMRTYEIGYSNDDDLRQLKRQGKITDLYVSTFTNETNNLSLPYIRESIDLLLRSCCPLFKFHHFNRNF